MKICDSPSIHVPIGIPWVLKTRGVKCLRKSGGLQLMWKLEILQIIGLLRISKKTLGVGAYWNWAIYVVEKNPYCDELKWARELIANYFYYVFANIKYTVLSCAPYKYWPSYIIKLYKIYTRQ